MEGDKLPRSAGLPNGNHVASDDEEGAWPSLHALQTVVRDRGLPPTVDRRANPQAYGQEDVTIVVLASLQSALPIFFEGNQQSPGCVVLVFESAWMTRDLCTADPKVQSLHVHTGIIADRAGCTYLDSFEPPREVMCLVDLNETSCGLLEAWPPHPRLPSPLSTPISGCRALGRVVDNRLACHALCADSGVSHPPCLALLRDGDDSLGQWEVGQHDTLHVACLKHWHAETAQLEKTVRDFLASPWRPHSNKVVIKPIHRTTPGRHGEKYAYSKKIKDTSDVTGIMEGVLELLDDPDLQCGVLVEAFFETFDPVVQHGVGRHAVNIDGSKYRVTMTAHVYRSAQNKARLAQVLCEIRDVNARTDVPAIPVSFEYLLKKWGISDVKEQRKIKDIIKHDAEAVMTKYIEKEALLRGDRLESQTTAQTDIMGLDFVLTDISSAPSPVAVKVVSHEHLQQVAVYETLHPRNSGQATRGFVQTLVSRASKFIMRRKLLVLIGGWKFNKRHVLEAAVDLGVQIILVDPNPEHPYKDVVFHFLHVQEMMNPAMDNDNANYIVDSLRDELGADFSRINGCVAFLDSFVPLSARVAEGLGLTQFCPSVQAIHTAKQKLLTHRTLGEARAAPPHWMAPAFFSSPVVSVKATVEDLEEAIQQVPLPAVLKVESGSSGRGVRHVRTRQEAEEHMQHVAELKQVNKTLGENLVMMKRVAGTEHFVDVVMFQQQLILAFVADKGPTREPLCFSTTCVMPTLLSHEEERQLIQAAVTCCRQVGLHTGVFNLDMMMTSLGPRLIEINPRMGGFYIYHWIRFLHDVDLVHLAVMAYCGVRPIVPFRNTSGAALRKEKGLMMGLNLWVHRHSQALSTTACADRLENLHEQGVVYFTRLKKQLTRNVFPFGNLAVYGHSASEARVKLTSILQTLGLETEESMELVLKDFVCLGR